MMDATTISFNFTDNATDYFLPTDETEEDTDQIIFQVTKILAILFDSVAFFLGTLGNGLVIWIAGFNMRKSVSIIWLLNLAFTDLLLNIFLALQIVEEIMDGHWAFNPVMCNMVLTAVSLNMSTSAVFEMIISIDHCVTVTCPKWSGNHRTPKLALVISILIWIICSIFTFPDFAFSGIAHDLDNDFSYCAPVYAEDLHAFSWYQAMYFVRFIFVFLIPLTVMFLSHGLLLHWQRKNKSLSGSSQPFKRSVTTILCFFCMWFPFYLWPFLQFMDIEISFQVDLILSNIVFALGFIDSCINPIIYAFSGRDFKGGILKSFPFLLESTFHENDETKTQRDQIVVETVIRQT
ncbi:chemerin-like receptor 1 [Hyperolius riggenbachi]|uniref:chemerin-like receptor 1 n=1 Tax=Hyperolius riggenbachi TaxID=752182 RepID=UPI0035A2E23B